jgi:hypothetical protein
VGRVDLRDCGDDWRNGDGGAVGVLTGAMELGKGFTAETQARRCL